VPKEYKLFAVPKESENLNAFDPITTEGDSNDTSEEFYIHGSVHRDSVLIRSNKMKQYVGIYLLPVYCT